MESIKILQKKNLFNRFLNYKPMPAQLKFHESECKFRAYIGGLGSGKSWAGAYEAIFYAINYPGTLGIIAAPTLRLLKDSTMRTFFELFPREYIEDNGFSRSNSSLKLINGSEILFRNCEDVKSIDRLRNIEIGWAWIDEGRGVPEYAFEVLIGRLRQNNGPLDMWVTTTPKGKYHWLHRTFVENLSKEYFYVHSRTKDNFYLRKDYLKSMEDKYTGTFAEQELEGKFVSFEGLVYPLFDRHIHVIDKPPEIIKEYVLGIDWGVTNPTAIVIIGLDYDNRMYIVDEVYIKKMDMEQLKSIISDIKTRYNYTNAYADPSGEIFIKTLNNCGLWINEAENAILPGISEVLTRLKPASDNKPRLYVLNSCSNTIDEFESYRYKDRKENRPEDEKPLKIKDHLMDAIRYACMGCKGYAGISVDTS